MTASSNRLKEINEEIVRVGRQLSKSHLVAGSWGNMSARVKDTVFAITPSGRDYASLKPKDIVLVDCAGHKLKGKLLPSSEMKLHAAIYQKIPEAQAILHTHSVYASILAAMRQELPPIVEDLAQIQGGAVPCAAYALPGTQELADHIVKALGTGQAAFMANHGLVCWGRDMQEAYLLAVLVEKTAQIYCVASGLKGAHSLTKKQVAIMHDFYLQHYFKRQRGGE